MFSKHYQILNFENYVQTASAFIGAFLPRADDSHKGTFGTLAVAGGATGMSGAVILAAMAAAYLGCGKVWACFNQASLPFALIENRPEIMLATTDKMPRQIDTYAIGCGMGLEKSGEKWLLDLLQTHPNTPMLLDADALTLLSRSPLLQTAAKAHHRLILTPHPAEAARLLDCTTADIQADRSTAAQTLAKTFGAQVVLKGCGSLIAAPDGSILTNRSGNPGLATAGSGDVLSGIIGSLLAQNIPINTAVGAGVWLHGAAADILRDNGIGETGLLAAELAPAARWLRNRLINALHPAM